MSSEPQTPGTFLEDSFSEPKPPVFDIGPSGVSGPSIIQAKLNRRLGPEYVSQRPAPGGGPKLTYVEGWKIIGLANEVFGYNGWCSTVTRIETDFIDTDSESRRYSIGVTALVKVTLRDGTYHEDIGYGTSENVRSKGAALDKAKKEAVTDGVKRALRNFGNLLGLCLYEKSFTQEVIKIKPQLPKFDEADLHRRERSASIPPSASSTHDVSSTMLTELVEDMKPVRSVSPQIRSAISKPSPLRDAILGAQALQEIHEDEHRLAMGSRTEITGEHPAQIAPLGKASPLHPDRTFPHGVQLPQQGSSSERNVASRSSLRQLDADSVIPRPPKASYSDPDTYFDDEDNDALLAIEDAAMQGVESRGALSAVGDADRMVTRSESPRGASGTRPQIAIASASTSSNRIPAPPLDQPMTSLRRAIRASTASLTAAGVKRPAEVIQSERPRAFGMGPGQQQQRLTANNGRRECLRDLPIHESTDVKRIKR